MDAFLDYLIKKSDINKEFSIESNNTKKKINKIHIEINVNKSY